MGTECSDEKPASYSALVVLPHNVACFGFLFPPSRYWENGAHKNPKSHNTQLYGSLPSVALPNSGPTLFQLKLYNWIGTEDQCRSPSFELC